MKCIVHKSVLDANRGIMGIKIRTSCERHIWNPTEEKRACHRGDSVPRDDTAPPTVIAKLRTTLGKFGEFWAYIAYFLLVRLGRKSILKI